MKDSNYYTVECRKLLALRVKLSDYFTNEKVSGGRTIVVEVPYNRIPVYVRL